MQQVSQHLRLPAHIKSVLLTDRQFYRSFSSTFTFTPLTNRLILYYFDLAMRFTFASAALILSITSNALGWVVTSPHSGDTLQCGQTKRSIDSGTPFLFSV
jgi:hypothetical protein